MRLKLPTTLKAEAVPRVEHNETYLAAKEAYRAAVAAECIADEELRGLRRDLGSTDALARLTAREQFPASEARFTKAQLTAERAERAMRAAREAALAPVRRHYLEARRRALVEIRDALRAVEAGPVREFLDSVREAIDAGLVVSPRDLLPELFWRDTLGHSQLDVWQDFHERNGNLPR